MAERMKALRTFRGKPGEGDASGKVRMGREFTVQTPARAQELENMNPSLAVRVVSSQARQTGKTTVQNKVVKTGPLASTGGRTGQGRQPLSLQGDLAPAGSQKQSAGSGTKTSASSVSTKGGA